MHDARLQHTATLLQDGRVLVAGGGLNSAELYDPNTGKWSLTGSLHDKRSSHTATLLGDGRVLATGGFHFRVTNFAALYDVATGFWTTTDRLSQKRYVHTATLLPDGTVLVAGGGNNINGNRVLRSAELYDPLGATWRSTRSLNDARTAHTATLLSSGKVLVTGGGNDSGAIASCEQYDSVTQTWALTAPLNAARSVALPCPENFGKNYMSDKIACPSLHSPVICETCAGAGSW